MRLKYFCTVSLKNGSLKRVWTLTHNNGCQRYDFWVITKRVINFVSVQVELSNKILFDRLCKQSKTLVSPKKTSCAFIYKLFVNKIINRHYSLSFFHFKMRHLHNRGTQTFIVHRQPLFGYGITKYFKLYSFLSAWVLCDWFSKIQPLQTYRSWTI